MDAYKKAQCFLLLLCINTVIYTTDIPQDLITGTLEEHSLSEQYSSPLNDLDAHNDINIVLDDELQNTSIEEVSDGTLSNDSSLESPLDTANFSERTIAEIVIHNNKYVATESIKNRIPYKEGELYDPLKKTDTIKNMLGMNRFENVALYAEPIGADTLKLHIYVKEKKLLKEMTFEGNNNLPLKEISKKGFDPKEISTIDAHELEKYVSVLKKLYREKNFHNVEIRAKLIPDEDKYIANFKIKENKPSIVQQVFFKGNQAFTDKVLRSKVFTREDWLLSFMDKSGMYHPDAIDSDSQTIEDFYQSNGFLNVKVSNVEVTQVPGTNFITITFNIVEGDLYTISQVSVAGNDIIPEEKLLQQIPIVVGQYYSKEKIKSTIELLRLIWGQHGYIDADIIPSIEPDDETKTVKLAFFTELGNKVHVKRINILGNQKTRDKVIRRQLTFEEGDLLTTANMEESKNRVEGLGFFEPKEGISWKINRKESEAVDVDLYVREVKTGRFDLQLGFGGNQKDIQNPTQAIKLGCTISDTNFLGRGIALNATGEVSKQEKQFLFNLTDPWLFDKPIFGAFDAVIKRTVYEEFNLTQRDIKENMRSASVSLGWIAEKLNFTKFISIIGYENINYSRKPMPSLNKILNPKIQVEYQCILDSRFPAGSVPWLGFQAGQDFRNHPLHPSRGYQWLFQSKLGIPCNDRFGFWRFDFDASYYTPIIGERDLVFYLHGHIGAITKFKGTTIPFRELYNIGGPASVRGFSFGEIGPMYQLSPGATGEPLGATKALWINAELVFPITSDFSIKGAVFYDGGAGWATPDASCISKKRLIGNGFDYRHAVGFGIRILQPTPVKIDWGFKLDRRTGEKESEVHFTMSRAF